jgi:hypothetical protein
MNKLKKKPNLKPRPYKHEYEKEEERKKYILAWEKTRKEELTRLNHYLGTLSHESNDITQFKKWVANELTHVSDKKGL